METVKSHVPCQLVALAVRRVCRCIFSQAVGRISFNFCKWLGSGKSLFQNCQKLDIWVIQENKTLYDAYRGPWICQGHFAVSWCLLNKIFSKCYFFHIFCWFIPTVVYRDSLVVCYGTRG